MIGQIDSEIIRDSFTVRCVATSACDHRRSLLRIRHQNTLTLMHCRVSQFLQSPSDYPGGAFYVQSIGHPHRGSHSRQLLDPWPNFQDRSSNFPPFIGGNGAGFIKRVHKAVAGKLKNRHLQSFGRQCRGNRRPAARTVIAKCHDPCVLGAVRIQNRVEIVNAHFTSKQIDLIPVSTQEVPLWQRFFLFRISRFVVRREGLQDFGLVEISVQ